MYHSWRKTVVIANLVPSVHRDTNLGTGRSMTCRPVGACPPELRGHGWEANRGARNTRVSNARNLVCVGAARSGISRYTRIAAPTHTHPSRRGSVDEVFRPTG